MTGSISEFACGLNHVTMMAAVSSSMVALKLYLPFNRTVSVLKAFDNKIFDTQFSKSTYV